MKIVSMSAPSIAVLFAAFVLATTTLAPSVSLADPLDDLSAALARFGGVGDETVSSYRVPVRIPDDETSSVAIDEIWRAPSDLVVRGHAASAPGAMVRSLALYLEPLYVARTAIVDLDWKTVGETVRTHAKVRASAEVGARTIIVDLSAADTPEERTALPAALSDVARFEASLDANERLRLLDVELLGDGGRIVVECDYDEKFPASQPSLARWTLPSGDEVVVKTTFRREGKRVLPASRRVTFPSRFDPKETEEICVEYGTYELNAAIPDSIWTSRGSFRYDENGLATTPR